MSPSLSCNLDLQVMWQGQSTLVQALTFSVFLMTVAITMQHLSLAKLSRSWHRGRLLMAACMALVAVAVGILAIVAYSLRSVKYHAGCEGEANIHRFYLGISIVLVCLEVFFTGYAFLFAARLQQVHAEP